MAAFNPDAGGVPSSNMPDQTGASRGTTPDRSFEALFSGVGDLVGGATKAINNDISKSIEKDAYAMYSDANKVITDSVPADLTNGAASLKTLQTAYEQGKITDTYYYGQLTAQSKALRAKYPGYEDVVDETISSVTGVKPANAYRNAILQEFADQANNASAAEKQEQQWIKENEEFIIQVAPDYFTNPTKYDKTQLRQAVATKKADVAVVNQENAKVNYLLSQGKLQDDQAAESATTVLNQQVNGFFGSVTAGVGLGGDDFLSKVNKMSSEGYSGEEYQGLLNQMNTAEVQLKSQLLKTINAPLVEGGTDSYASILGSAAANKLVEDSMAQFTAIKDMVTNKETGLAGYYTRLNATKGDAEFNRILNASPDLNTAYALKNISPDLSGIFLTESGKQTGIFAQIAAPEISANIAVGNDSLNGATDRIVNSRQDAQSKAGGINAIVDNSIGTIKSGVASDTEMTNTIKSTYALDAKGKDIFQYVKPEEYKQLYGKLFNNSITDAIAANGSKTDQSEYYKAMIDRVFATPELKTAAGTLSQINSEWGDLFKVTVRPDGKFALDVKESGVPLMDIMGNAPGNKSGLLGGITYTWAKGDATKAINAINDAFDTIGYASEKFGGDKSDTPKIYESLLNRFNIELEQGKKGGFFDWLKGAIGLFNSADENNSDPAMGLTFDVPGSTDTSSIDSFMQKARAAESGGNDSAKNPNSSASGPYQFIDSTWKRYANRLGLTDKTDPEQQKVAMKALTTDNANALSNSGIDVNDATLYAAHFLGSDGAVEVLSASDDTPLSDLVPPRVINANSFLRGMTVADFKRWSKKTIG